MRILLITQNDYVLINRYSIELIASLQSLGVAVDVALTPPSSDGKKTRAWENIAKAGRRFGWAFTFRLLVSALAGWWRWNLPRWCKRAGVALCDVKFDNLNSPAYVEKFKNARYDSALILAGNRIIKKPFLDAFGGNVVNVHSSLLPCAKGLMPAFWTLKAGRGTGVTLFRLDEGIDTGPVLKRIPLCPAKTTTLMQYFHQTKKTGIELLTWYVIGRMAEPEAGEEESYNPHPEAADVKEFCRRRKLS